MKNVNIPIKHPGSASEPCSDGRPRERASQPLNQCQRRDPGRVWALEPEALGWLVAAPWSGQESWAGQPLCAWFSFIKEINTVQV